MYYLKPVCDKTLVSYVLLVSAEAIMIVIKETKKELELRLLQYENHFIERVLL